MKANPNKEQIISIDTFKRAIVQLLKCKSKDVDIRMIEDNRLAVATYNNDAYRIATKAFLYEDAFDSITDEYAVTHLSLPIWIGVTKNTISVSRFLPGLALKLENAQQAQLLQLALSIYSFTDDDISVFWNTLENIDKEGTLLSNAIISAAAAYNTEVLAEDIMELNIINGVTVYNWIQGGIFETVYVGGDNSQYPEFYIYSVEYNVE